MDLDPKIIWLTLGIAFNGIIGCGPVAEKKQKPVETTGSDVYNPYGPGHRGQLEIKGEKNFAHLINNYLEGKAEPTPWAGFWWPYRGNGIAAGTFGGSPAGKYDAARGNSTHAQLWEMTKHGTQVPKAEPWWGHCNGWCAASALYPEPHSPVVINGVEFGIGDQKALLSEAGMSANADYFGERFDAWDSMTLANGETNPKYLDVVPDQYFLVLTNYMGKLKKAVLIDRHTGSEVWNQPLAGYRFEYPKKEDYLGPLPGAPNVYGILVGSSIWWMEDGVAPDVQTVPFAFENSDASQVSGRELKMEVWLDGPVEFDSSGKITKSGDVIVTRNGDYVAGGAWRMGDGYMNDAWPDYMWIPYSLVKPTDPDEDYANPEVEIQWLEEHLLKGVDDPTVTGGTVAPTPQSTGTPGSGYPSWPSSSGNYNWPSTNTGGNSSGNYGGTNSGTNGYNWPSWPSSNGGNPYFPSLNPGNTGTGGSPSRGLLELPLTSPELGGSARFGRTANLNRVIFNSTK